MARYNTESPVIFELEDKQQKCFEYKYVPCIIGYILILKELFIVYLKFKFNWVACVFICSNTHNGVHGKC